jgi:predicted alpha/beta superfamily hydrolase
MMNTTTPTMTSKMMDGRQVTLFPAQRQSGTRQPETPDQPLPTVYCNSYGDRGEELLQFCHDLGSKPFHMALISNLQWDADLSPWPVGRILSKQDDFRGQATEYLDWMQHKLIPEVEKTLDEPSPIRILAGYSMAGLFAINAIYHTDIFKAIVSASGSLWYPDFETYALTHAVIGHPAVYISIGDKESNSKNQYLSKTVGICEHLAAHYSSTGLDATFELNPGNHFTDMDLRQARGITWALNTLNAQQKP